MIRNIGIVILMSAFCCAHAENSYMAPLVKQSMLLDVTQASSTVIVGERGHVLYQDSEQFIQASVPTVTTLTAVMGIGTSYWAVGHDATILKSTDGPNNWQLVNEDVELDRPFLDVLFMNEQLGFAVGGYGLFYRTEDGGLSWQSELHASVLSEDDIDYLETIKDDQAFYEEELSFILPHFNRLNTDGERLLLAGESGLLASSLDLGRTWERFDIDYQGSFFDLQALPNGLLLAVGLRGNMFVLDQTTENDEWEFIQTCITTSLNAIISTEHGMFVVGNNGVILKIDPNALLKNEYQDANKESCRTHTAVERIESDISSTISNAYIHNNALIAITATGIFNVALEK